MYPIIQILHFIVILLRAGFCWWGPGANIEDGSSLIIHWSSGSLGDGAVPPTQNFFLHFLSSKSLVLVHFSAIFASSSTTYGLLRNDLSGGGPFWWGAMAPLDPLNPAWILLLHI